MRSVFTALFLASLLFTGCGEKEAKKSDGLKVVSGHLGLHCIKCGAEFTSGFLPPIPQDAGKSNPLGGLAGYDCQKCGASKMAILMTACPRCQKYFVTQEELDYAVRRSNSNMSENEALAGPSVRGVCPRCGFDTSK